MQSARPANFSMLPEIVKNLLIINGIFFLAKNILPTIGIDLNSWMALFYPASAQFKPHQFITHMFMHGDLMHLFFNMFVLWMFGTNLENVWGHKKFLVYYILCGLGASLLHLGVNFIELKMLLPDIDGKTLLEIKQNGYELIKGYRNFIDESKAAVNLIYNVPVVGASGAVYGLLMAYGLLYPNQTVYLYFMIPVKMKWAILGLIVIELFGGFGFQNSNIAHFAHLGGMLFGFFLIKYWESKGNKYL